jgi:hypothetical protein
MDNTLAHDHPNLLQARKRLRRVLWGWAGISAAVGILMLLGERAQYPLASLPWFATAILLTLSIQPPLLALAAVLWGISLTTLMPGLGNLVGHDPLGALFGGGLMENLAIVLVRILLLIMSWNQFMFYRMLYGTANIEGLDSSLPSIPEIIENRSDRIAVAAPVLGLIGVSAAVLALISKNLDTVLFSSAIAYSTCIFAIGFGLGAAFSPTYRRKAALLGTGLGLLAFLLILAIPWL